MRDLNPFMHEMRGDEKMCYACFKSFLCTRCVVMR